MAQLVSQAIVDRQIAPMRVFEKMELDDAVRDVVSLRKMARGKTGASFLERDVLVRGMIECIPLVRAKFANGLTIQGTTFIFRELTSGRFDEVRFRVLLTSYFMLGEQRDLARWAATASDLHLEDLHERVYDRRILDGLFSNDDPTDDLLSMKRKTIPTEQSLDELLTRHESLQRGNERLPAVKPTTTAGQKGSAGGGEGKSSGGGGGFDDPAGAIRYLIPLPPSRDHHDATAQNNSHSVFRLMLLDYNACASDWRGKREIPFGDFSAVLRGEFTQGGVFHAREVASNEAGFALLDRVKSRNTTVITFYGCLSTLQTVSVQAPIAAVISSAQNDDRCTGHLPERALSEPSMICVESAWRRRAYDVRTVGRVVR